MKHVIIFTGLVVFGGLVVPSCNAADLDASASRTPPVRLQAYGPRIPVGPRPFVACHSSSILVHPSSDVARIVASSPPGSTFCFAPGTYIRLHIETKAGDRFMGEYNSVLDGRNVTRRAFSGVAPNIVIQNFVIRNYTAPPQDAPINNCAGGGGNWTIQNNEIANNAGAGIMVCGNGTRVVANYLHDNRQEGYSCTRGLDGGVDIEITDNEIAHNNPDDGVSPDWEAGGGKCTFTTRLVLSHNYSHDNHGPGLWTDLDNQMVDIEYNLVKNNLIGGIFHEISWDGTIAYNIVENNAKAQYCKGWLWCGQIGIAASGGTKNKILDVYNNVVVSTSPGNGIVLIQQNRGNGLHGAHLVQNVHVHDNSIDMSGGGVSGGVTDTGDAALFHTRGNSFDHNQYSGYRGQAFWWNGASGDLQWFKSQGQEVQDDRL